MNNSSDETDKNTINNNTINHPLSNVNDTSNLNGEDDMTEINLKWENSKDSAKRDENLANTIRSPEKTTPTKSTWVKFDDENNEYERENEVKTSSSNNQSNIQNNNTVNASRPVNIATQIETSPNKQQNANLKSTKVGTPALNASPSGAAVLTTESTHVNIDRLNSSLSPNSNSNHESNINNQTSHPPNQPKNVEVAIPVSSSIRTVELSTGRIREGFANGDVIVNLLPTNTKWPWITPAVFRPELVPEELMAQGLTLTVEEYVSALETLVNDYRFTMYNICYKRVLVCWIAFAFCVLLVLLFSGLQGIALFSLGVAWLFLNASAIFACMWIKLRLSRGLEKCLARVNKLLLRHKILLVLDDRGRISCHKVNLCFMYFDPAQCIAYLNEFIERQEQLGNNIQAGWEKKLDLDVSDIVIQGSTPVRLSRKQAIAQEIFLSYLQRWGKDFLRRRLDWTCNEAGVHEQPRHLMSSVCPCQYEEEIMQSKIKLEQDKARCCCGLHNPFKHL